MGVADEVRGDDVVFGVGEDAFHGSVGCGLHGLLDIVVGGGLLELGGQVDDGDVDDGDAEGHAGELAVEFGDDLADGLGGAGGGGDDVVARGAAAAPVLHRGSVDGLLGGGDGVDGGHEALLDAEVVVDHLGHGRQTVRRARRVRDDVHRRFVFLQVHAADEHGRVRRRRGNHNLLRPALEMGTRFLRRREHPRRLDDVLGAARRPLDVRRILLPKDLDRLPVHHEAVADLHRTGEHAVGRVVLHHVLHVVQRNEGIVHPNDRDRRILRRRTHHEPPDAPEAIDPNLNRPAGSERG
mmetsp:Transcript_23903/g.76897  ORF Transcript_23903/g.76897 Transcript_23903/m.76897 type:complete len:296 (-) Transcript_23903:40-927(-)